MNKTITLEFPEKKQEALSHFLKKKDTTIEAELDYALAGYTKRPCRPPSGNSWRTQDRTAIHLRISKITYKDCNAMDGKNRELTPEEEAAELAKPGSHPGVGNRLAHRPSESHPGLLGGRPQPSDLLDCLWDELYGSTNANQWGWEISKEQADYLRAKYLFEPEDEEEAEIFGRPNHETQRCCPTKPDSGFFCTQQQGPGEPLLAPVWPR